MQLHRGFYPIIQAFRLNNGRSKHQGLCIAKSHRSMSSTRVQRSHQERGDGAVPLYPLSRTARTTGSTRTARTARRAKQELPEEQKKELKEAFELFDTGKIGSIDYHELKVLMRALGFQVTKREVLDLVEDVDVQRSGRVDFNDYMEIMRRKVLARDPDEEIARAFELFDEDGSGTITLRKMRRVAKELGENLGDDELQAMIDEFDQNQDGEIDMDEFFMIMKQSTEF